MQLPHHGLPIGTLGTCLRPRLQLFNQSQALGLVLSALELDLFNPNFHDFMGSVAGLIKALPQRMVGQSALIHNFPLLS